MTKEELAEKLNCSQYPFEPSDEIIGLARESNLMIIFGDSDDLMEIRGLVTDEFNCFDGGECMIDSQGILPSWDYGDYEDEDEAEKYFKRKKTAVSIEAQWCNGDYSWTYKTDIPHATFDIMEESEKYCRGIIYSTDDLRKS